jgi:uncharacterized protein (TIGR02246 family)
MKMLDICGGVLLLLILSLLTCSISPALSGELNMAPESIEQVVEQAKTAWQDGDADRFAELFLPDGELVVPGQRWQGRAAIRQAVLDFSSTHSQVKIEIQRIVSFGDCVLVEWTWEDVEKSTGERSQAEDAIVIDFQANQVRRWREYIDTQTP